MDYEDLKDKIVERLHDAYGNDFDSGCYVNGKWLSVNDVLDIVLQEIELNGK